MYLSKRFQDAEKAKINNPSACASRVDEMEAARNMIFGNMQATMDCLRQLLMQRVLACMALQNAQDDVSRERLRELIDEMTEQVRKILIL